MGTQAAQIGTTRPTRRSFMVGALAGTVALGTKSHAAGIPDLTGIKALTFDMQGTVFDFYGPMLQAAQAIGRRHGFAEGWATTLPGDWSTAAHGIIVEIATGQRAWVSNAEVYRETLTPLLAKRGVASRMSQADCDELLARWGEMIPWPDAVSGIGQLRRLYTISTLTNASMAQMTALVKRSSLPFDAILTGELNRAFKPDPRVYRLAVDYIGFRPDQLMMVSAHKWDLFASKQVGFRTAYVPRPFELGPGHSADRTPERFIDIIADDLVDLADRIVPAGRETR